MMRPVSSVHRPVIAVLIAATLCAVAARAIADPTPAASAPTIAPNPTPDPNELYVRAIREMRTLAKAGEPPYIVYDLHIQSRNLQWTPQVEHGVTQWEGKLDHADQTADYRVWYRSKDQQSMIQDAKTGAIYYGETLFAPDVTDISDQPSPNPSPGASATPQGGSTIDVSAAKSPVIGAVTVEASRDYRVTYGGEEARDGAQCYHIHLVALRDPMHNPLTDMWVDTHDDRVWAVHGIVTVREVAAGFGGDADADWAPSPSGDKFMLSSFAMAAKGYFLLWHVNVATTMTTHIVAMPASLPDSYFRAASPKP